jgi:hypothetical protein
MTKKVCSANYYENYRRINHAAEKHYSTENYIHYFQRTEKDDSSKIMVHYEVPTHLRYLLGSHSGKYVEWGPLGCNVSQFKGYCVFMLDFCFSYSSALKMEAMCATTQKNTLFNYNILFWFMGDVYCERLMFWTISMF